MTSPLKKVVSGLVLAGLAVFAYVHLRGPQGIPALLEKRQAIQELEENNRLLAIENAKIRARNAELQNPQVLELEIRNRLNKLRRGEIDFKLPEDPAPAQNPH